VVRLWDGSTREYLGQLQIPSAHINAVCFFNGDVVIGHQGQLSLLRNDCFGDFLDNKGSDNLTFVELTSERIDNSKTKRPDSTYSVLDYLEESKRKELELLKEASMREE